MQRYFNMHVFAMFMIFHKFEVISENNCRGSDNEIRKSIKLSGV